MASYSFGEVKLSAAKRLLTPEEADVFVGEDVTQKKPTVNGNEIIFDADTGEPIAAHLKLPTKTTELLRWAVETIDIPFGGVARKGTGLTTQSRTFGMAPRKPIQLRDACKPTSLASDAPLQNAALAQVSMEMGEMLAEFAPHIYAESYETMQQVDKDWKLTEESIWTSGVVNWTAQLPYHRDGFNFDTWAAMPVVRSGVDGGHLHIPEYDITLACRDGYASFFCGLRLVHGVTPMTVVKENGYRCSIVYYALRGMKDCFTHAIEQRRAGRKRTSREKGMREEIILATSAAELIEKRRIENGE
jgi:hypothetical protein